MKEVVKFVWENEVFVSLTGAKKERKYEDMKKRLKRISEAIKKLGEVKRMAEQAEKFGVLECEVWAYFSEDIIFDDGRLSIAYGNIKSILREIYDVEEIQMDEFRDIVRKDWRNVIDRFIRWEKEQYQMMEQYFKEAEDYLVVNLVVIDYEEEEEDCE